MYYLVKKLKLKPGVSFRNKRGEASEHLPCIHWIYNYGTRRQGTWSASVRVQHITLNLSPKNNNFTVRCLLLVHNYGKVIHQKHRQNSFIRHRQMQASRYFSSSSSWKEKSLSLKVQNDFSIIAFLSLVHKNPGYNGLALIAWSNLLLRWNHKTCTQVFILCAEAPEELKEHAAY